MPLNSIPADSPLGRVWGEPVGALLSDCEKEKEMNLSSCVADSVVLSFDSAGQTLGSGTSSFLLSPFQLSALATFEGEPQEVGGVWGRAGEQLRIVGNSQGAFLGRQGLGSRVDYHTQKTLLVALKCALQSL